MIPEAGGDGRDIAKRTARRRRRILLAVGGAVIVATPFLPYDDFVDTGLVRMRLTRVKAGVYETSSPDEPRRLFYLQSCAAPANDTRVTARNGWTFGRLEFMDVRFPSGELCSGFALFATPEEDRGVVQTARSGGLASEQKS